MSPEVGGPFSGLIGPMTVVPQFWHIISEAKDKAMLGILNTICLFGCVRTLGT